MTQVIIKNIVTKGVGSPMILTFQNGYPTDHFQKQPFTVLHDVNTDKNVYVTDIDDMLYTGSETTDTQNTVIIARNKVSGKVRLIETGYIEMKPELDVTDNHVYETTNLELSRKFGSKKQKQQMEQREKMKVNIDTVNKQMIKVTEDIREEQLDLASYTKNNSVDFYIPPINRTADKVKEVYDINKVLTEEEYEKVAAQLEDKDFKSDMLPWLQSIISNKDLPSKHLILLVYADCLLKLYNTVAKEISKKTFSACSISTTLNEVIIKNFTSQINGKIMRPGPYRDKALCYAIVLILLVNNLKFDLEGFCQAMKLTANNASMKVRTTGASVVTIGKKKVVQLKLPLNTKSGFRRKSAKF